MLHPSGYKPISNNLIRRALAHAKLPLPRKGGTGYYPSRIEWYSSDPERCAGTGWIFINRSQLQGLELEAIQQDINNCFVEAFMCCLDPVKSDDHCIAFLFWISLEATPLDKLLFSAPSSISIGDPMQVIEAVDFVPCPVVRVNEVDAYLWFQPKRDPFDGSHDFPFDPPPSWSVDLDDYAMGVDDPTRGMAL